MVKVVVPGKATRLQLSLTAEYYHTSWKDSFISLPTLEVGNCQCRFAKLDSSTRLGGMYVTV